MTFAVVISLHLLFAFFTPLRSERLAEDFVSLPSNDRSLQCVFPSSRAQLGSSCVCDHGFHGSRCAEPICQNGGTAVRWTTRGGYRRVGCICTLEYNGKFCEKYQNSGSLKCDKNSNFSVLPSGQCACNYPKSGMSCQKSAGHQLCSNGSGVFDSTNGVCYCFFPYDGRECQDRYENENALISTTSEWMESTRPSMRPEHKPFVSIQNIPCLGEIIVVVILGAATIVIGLLVYFVYARRPKIRPTPAQDQDELTPMLMSLPQSVPESSQGVAAADECARVSTLKDETGVPPRYSLIVSDNAIPYSLVPSAPPEYLDK